MNKLLREVIKSDVAIVPTALAPAAMAISGLYPLDRYGKAKAVIGLLATTLQGGDVLDIGIVDDTVLTPAASGDLAALEAAGDVLHFEHITASTGVTRLSIETAASGDGAITINGVVFPYAAAPATPLEWSTAAQLATAITGAGLGLTAAAVGTVVTINSTVPGERAITMTETVTAIIAADILTLRAVAILEVDASELAPGATGIYVVIDNPVANTGTVAQGFCVLERGDPRYAPVTQAVAAPL